MVLAGHKMFSKVSQRSAFSWVPVNRLGWLQALLHHIHRSFHRRARRRPFRLFSRDAKYPLLCRPGTTDILVFDQLYIWREYRCLDDLDPLSVGLVVDCGAYVGYSSAYF